MKGINKAILVGRLGKEPEAMNNGCRFSIATSNSYMNKQGKRVDDTQWHNIVVFGNLAEICLKYLTKGAAVYIEGAIKTSKYTDKNGIERYNTSIMANQMQMLSGKSEAKGGDVDESDDFDDIPF